MTTQIGNRPKKAAEEESAEEDGRPAAEGEGDAGGEGGEQGTYFRPGDLHFFNNSNSSRLVLVQRHL